MEINKLRDEVHELAIEKGWYDGHKREFPELIALCHSELSEALEEYRDGNPNIYYKCAANNNIANTCDCACTLCSKAKPEGLPVELADCIIRILDMCGYMGIDIEEVIRIKHEYNKTRPYRHGKMV